MENKTNKDEKVVENSEEGLDEVLGEVYSDEKIGILRQLNVSFPWLKVVMAILLGLLVGFGTVAGVRQRIVANEVAEKAAEEEKEAGGAPEEGDKTDDKGKTVLGEIEKHEEAAPMATQEIAERYYNAESVPLPGKMLKRAHDLTGKKLVALTFDDGPSPATTPRLLQILEERQVWANFFVVGTMVERSPEIVQRAEKLGHEIGSHTMRHANLSKMSAAAIQADVQEMDAVLMRTLGHGVTLMRPPYGSVNGTVRQQMPQPMILWTVDTEDWKYKDAKRVADQAVGAAFDGAIILMHDIHSTTVDAVPEIIDRLRAEGFEFVTVTEMAELRGQALERGWTYGAFRP